MQDFDPDKFLQDLQNSNLPDEAKDKCEILRKNLYYVAPEFLGEYFFNGFKTTWGLCKILETYANNNYSEELQNDMTKRYKIIYTSYEKWKEQNNF